MNIKLDPAPSKKESRQPTHFEQAFFPYFQTFHVEDGESYIQTCLKQLKDIAIRSITKNPCDSNIRAIENILQGINISNTKIRLSEKYFTCETSQKHGQLAFLDYLADTLNRFEGNIVSNPKKVIEVETTDMVLGCLKTPDIIAPMIKIALDNKDISDNKNKFKIVEYGEGSLDKILLPWMHDANANEAFEYVKVVQNRKAYMSNEGDKSTTFCEWDLISKPPKEIYSADLVLVDQAIYNNESISFFKTVSKYLKKNGFMLLHCATKNHLFAIISKILRNIELENASNTLIENLHKCFDDMQVKQSLQTINLNLVSLVSSDVLHSVFLFRQKDKNKHDSPDNIVDVSSLSPTWVDEIKTLMNENKRMWLISREGCNGVSGMIRSIRKEQGGQFAK